MHLLDYIIIPVFAHIREAGGKNNISALFAREEHLFKQQIIHVIVVHQTGAGNEVELVLEPLWVIFWVA